MNQRKVLHAAAAAAADGTIMQTRNALLAVQVSGTFVATVTWKITVDGTNWITVEGVSRANGERATTATAPGIYLIPAIPGGAFMADITAYVSGSVTVTVLDTDGHVDLSDTGAVVVSTLPALVAGTAMVGSVQDAGPGAGAGIVQAPVHGDCSTATALTAAPTAGQKWVVTDIIISTAAAAEVHLEEETSATVVWGPMILPANFAGQFTPRGKLKLATADKKVMVKSSTADHITAQISGLCEA